MGDLEDLSKGSSLLARVARYNRGNTNASSEEIYLYSYIVHYINVVSAQMIPEEKDTYSRASERHH